MIGLLQALLAGSLALATAIPTNADLTARNNNNQTPIVTIWPYSSVNAPIDISGFRDTNIDSYFGIPFAKPREYRHEVLHSSPIQVPALTE
jgi:hypothetical protein